MANEEKVLPTHKWIIVNDLNRELSPIGISFQSPIYKPSKFSVDTIGQLLNVSGVTAMFEVFEADHTFKVHLDNKNFREPFEEIWSEQNPGKTFPWGNTVETFVAPSPSVVDTTPPKAPAEDPPKPVSDEVVTPPTSNESSDQPTDQGTTPPVEGESVTDAGTDSQKDSVVSPTSTVTGDQVPESEKNNKPEQSDSGTETEESSNIEGSSENDSNPKVESGNEGNDTDKPVKAEIKHSTKHKKKEERENK